MRIKILPTRTLFIAVLVLGALSAPFFSHFSNFNRQKLIQNGSTLVANVAAFSEQEKPDSPLPVRLKIPELNIDATIEYVGLAKDGSVDAPKDPNNVAWFNLGPRPGEVGDSVIDGHSGYKDNKPAIFDSLVKLQKGDKIYVKDEKGTTLTFVVREFRTYNLNEDVSNVFRSSDGASHLNLITCSGAWDEKDKTHATRLIVFTDLTS